MARLLLSSSAVSEHAYSLYALLAAGCALVVTLLIASQPPLAVLALVAIAGIAVCVLVHPVAAFALVMALSPLRTLINTEAPALLPFEIGILITTVMLGGWVAWRVARGEPLLRFRWTPLYALVGGFFAVVSLSLFSALAAGPWLNEWLKWAIMLVVIALVMSVRRWQWVAVALCVAGAGHAVVGLYTFLGGSGALHLLINDRFFRAFGSFGQPNPFGGFMGLVTPLAFALCLGAFALSVRQWRVYRRVQARTVALLVLTGICGTLTLAGVIASWSRGAWLAVGVALVVVLVMTPRLWWRRVSVLVFMVALAGGLWFSGRLPSAVTERLVSATRDLLVFDDVRGVDITPANYAIIERLAHWQAAVNMAQDRFYLGVGMGNYEIAYDNYRLINWREPLGHAHNYYLNVWAEAGIIGLLAYGVLWFGVILVSLRAMRHPDLLARSAVVGLLGSWVYLSLHSLTDSLYVNNLFLHLGFMLGLLAVLEAQTRTIVRLHTK